MPGNVEILIHFSYNIKNLFNGILFGMFLLKHSVEKRFPTFGTTF